MIGVILAAGNGSRLKESKGEQCCKILEKVSNQRLIEFALKNLVELKINKVLVVVGEHGDLIRQEIGNSYENMDITYIPQSSQLGLINAFVQALPYINNETVVFQLADEIFVEMKADAINQCLASATDFYCGITYEQSPDKIKGNFSVEIDSHGNIKKCVEKPTQIINNIKGTGFCIFKSAATDFLSTVYNEVENTPYDLCDFINLMTTNNICGKILEIAKKEFNINTMADLEEAQLFLKTNSGESAYE